MSATQRLPATGGRRAALAVLLGHALLLLAVGRALAPQRPPAAPSQPPMLVWLRLQAPEPPTQPRTVEAPLPRSQARRRQPEAAAPISAPVTSVAPAIVAPPAPQALATPRSAAPPPDPPSQAPLDLRWRPAPDAVPRAVDLVRQARDPTDRRDGDARLARALGTDTRLHEEVRGEVRRFRRAGSCVDTRATRESQINPIDAGAGRMPRLVEPC